MIERLFVNILKVNNEIAKVHLFFKDEMNITGINAIQHLCNIMFDDKSVSGRISDLNKELKKVLEESKNRLINNNYSLKCSSFVKNNMPKVKCMLRKAKSLDHNGTNIKGKIIDKNMDEPTKDNEPPKDDDTAKFNEKCNESNIEGDVGHDKKSNKSNLNDKNLLQNDKENNKIDNIDNDIKTLDKKNKNKPTTSDNKPPKDNNTAEFDKKSVDNNTKNLSLRDIKNSGREDIINDSDSNKQKYNNIVFLDKKIQEEKMSDNDSCGCLTSLKECFKCCFGN